MKLLLPLGALLALLPLSSCNTLIGVGRDPKEGFIWTKNKIQEKTQGGGGGQQDSYDQGAPVY